jgi:hypothetical protein
MLYFNNVLLISCLLVTGSLLAQPQINRIDSLYGGTPGGSIIRDDSTYVLLTSYNMSLHPSDIQIIRLDLMGNIIDSSTFARPDISLSIPGNALKKLYNQNMIGVINHWVDSDSTYIEFVKFNTSLDTVHTKLYFEKDHYMPFISDMEIETDSTFIVSGGYYRKENNKWRFSMMLTKLDTNFNIIWNQKFDYPLMDSNWEGGYTDAYLELDNYGSIIVSGGCRIIGPYSPYPNPNPNYYYSSYVGRFSIENGDSVWVKDIRTVEPGSQLCFVKDNGDGEYRFIYRAITYYSGNSFGIRALRFGAIDTNGTLLWSTRFMQMNYLYNIWDMTTTLDGNYYVSGNYVVSDSTEPGGIYLRGGCLKISPQGDSLWFRELVWNDSSDFHEIYSFQECPDSGFIHLGQMADRDFDINPNRTVYSWVVKTDKWGCIVSGCESLNVQEYLSDSFSPLVYPNPTYDGTIYIDINQEGAVPIKMFDLTGRLLFSDHVFSINGVIQIDGSSISQLSNGFYLIQVDTWIEKILIQMH